MSADARTVTGAGGIQLYAEAHGDASSPTFVFIRGLGSQLIQWPASLVSGLVTRGYRVLTMDNRDAGLSQKCEAAPEYDLDDMASDVASVMDAYSVASAHIFGISLGGMICQRFASRYPSRTITAFPVMTHAGGAGHISQHVLDTQVFVSLPASAGKAALIAASAASMKFGDCPGHPTPEKDIYDMSTRCFERCFCPDGERRQGAAMGRGPASDRRESNRTISSPTLVIHGKDDKLINVTGGQEVALSVPRAEMIVVDGMGHSISEGLGDPIAGKVHDFILRRGGTGSTLRPTSRL